MNIGSESSYEASQRSFEQFQNKTILVEKAYAACAVTEFPMPCTIIRCCD